MIFSNDTLSANPNSNYLVTLSEAKAYITPVTDDIGESLTAFLDSAIQIISDKIEEYVGHGIIAQNYTGYYDGNGRAKLFVENYPINNLISLQFKYNPTDTSWNDFYSGSQTGNQVAYSNHIQLWTQNFPCGMKNIKVVYNAGYTVVPGDIKQIALEAIQEYYNYSKQGNDTLGFKSKTFGGESAQTAVYENLWDKHKEILNRYRTIII